MQRTVKMADNFLPIYRGMGEFIQQNVAFHSLEKIDLLPWIAYIRYNPI